MQVAAAPVSFAQQGLWYQAELEPGNPAYHVPIALRLRGAIDPAALMAALDAIAARHEILRTTFALDGAELIQVIHPGVRLPFREESIGDGEEELARRIHEEIHEPFDLLRGPLLRSVLFRRSSADDVLLMTLHHLVTDGWSLGIMVKELAAFYRSSTGSDAEPLPELAIQYADFAEWQREQAGGAWAGQLAYWKERLRPPMAYAELPTDFPRPVRRSFQGATETFRIPLGTLDQLRQLSMQTGSTLFMTLLAAFKVLLYRHTNVTDVVVGSPVAGRNGSEIEDLVGFFVNTQVLRTTLAGNPSFIEVLARVRETALGAWENQDVPFEMLTSVLQPERKREPSPFFQVMFALQNAPRGTLVLPGVSIEPMDVVTDTAKFALTVINEEVPDGLEVRMEYSTALFTRQTIRRVAGRYERLLEAICAEPLCSIDQIPMLPEAERALLEQWAGGGPVFDVPDGLHRWFEAQAGRTPDNVAVRCEERDLNYRELDERSNRLANHLKSLGVGPETLVGLCLDRSIELLVGILGILKAGGAYVPLDPSYPANRLRFAIEDSRVPVVVTTSAHESLLRDAPRLVALDRDRAAIDTQPASAPPVAVDPGQAAYVIYTSGSTGRPKGVVVTHGNVMRLFRATESLYDFRDTDVWTLFHSYAFDFSVWEMWGALLYGGRIVVVPYATSRTPAQFHSLLENEGVTVLNQTPSAFYQLMEHAAPPSLRYVIFGGEALDIVRLRAWFERHGDERPQLVNMYGITETTVHVTHRRIRTADLDDGLASVIGRALPDLTLRVLDPSGALVPAGVAGELYVGGAGVARGYLRRDDLTAARFLDRGSERLYRSGDLVRWLATGELEYLGRIDTQVKIRGFRIELEEIEHVLRAGGGLADVVVIARPGPSDQPRLIAYGVPEEGRLVTPGRLRQVCEEQLPDYMVPSAYVTLDAFPLTPNGKLDRDALPDPDLEHDVVHETYVAPTNEVETTLARIWAEVLQIDRAGITDNFFALGGDSILLLQVAAKAAKAGVKLSRRNMVEHQTIQELAALARPAAPAVVKAPAVHEDTAVTSAALPSPADDVYPLTPMQQGLLFHTVYAPEQDFYIEQLHAELNGVLDLAAFEKAWQTVIARNAVLRTSFEWDGTGAPRQRVHHQVPFRLELDDWRGLDGTQQAERLAQRLAEDRALGFDLSRAPLTRVALFRLAGERWQWLWTHHHLVLDGWSLTAVVGEVLTCYGAFSRGEEPRLVDRRPYRDYIDWLDQQDTAAAEAFWREALAGFAEPTPCIGFQRTDGATDGRGELEVALSKEQTARLQSWARHHQVTLNTVVTGAWAKLLQTYGGSDDVVFGVTVSGRPAELAGYEHMVGPFINTLPLRLGVDAAAPLDSWLRQVQKQHGALREYEFSRLVDIQRWSALPAGEALFDTLLVFENYPVDASLREHASGLTFGAVTFVERGHYGLALAAIPGETLALRLYFDGARFDTPTMRRVLEQLRQLLNAAATEDVGSVGTWSLLGASERQQLRAVEAPRIFPRCVHELFEEQADKTPDRLALVLGDQRLTYRELDLLANRLAHSLRRRGAGPDVIVGINLERSIEMIVAVLAVWKAGAAYLPLDPSYPERRIAHMLEDSDARLIVSVRDFGNLTNESTERPSSGVTADHLAYVIYTSGSTGLPKGTLVEHRGVTNLAHALAQAFTIDAESRVLQFASLSFDVSVTEIVMALCFGAALQLAHRDEVLPGPAFAELLRDRRITHLSVVPSVLASMPFIPLPDLRCLIVGGEPCPPDLLAQWSAGRQFFNCYGPTEATVCSTYSLYSGGKLTIGAPIANARTYVLDGHGQAVPAGAPGELHIGGPGVARGYLARPGLTSERFIPDPFSGERGARLYKTGDLVRLLPDGNLEFLGRLDRQVKIRGFRIEPDEIAQVLRSRCGLSEAAVVARSGRLVAYGVPAGDIPTRELRERCQEWLPEHMVPSAWVLLEALPLTPSGKLDRDALPDPDPELHVVREAFVASTNEVEAALANAWSEILGVARVGIEDNFFELGGDSILSLQVVSRAAQAGLQITPRDVFQHPTVAALARVAGRKRADAAPRESLPSHPLTPVQRWFFEQGLTHPDHWNQAVLVEVSPSLSSETLAKAIHALGEHHDVFRSRFAGGKHRYANEGIIAFEAVALPADIVRHADGAHASLSLEQGPLARAIHFAGDGKSYLLVVIHHLIVDGVSWRILLEDLSQLCRGEPLEPALSFGEWARRLETFANTSAIDVDYWLGLDASDFHPLPQDTPPAAVPRVGTTGIVELRLGSQETDALLRRIPAIYRTQVNDVLLAAFAAAMRTWTGRNSVWVNLEGHGREMLLDDADLSRTAGWFTSLFPVRLHAPSNKPATLLQSIKEQLRAIPQNGVGFGLARYMRGDERLASLPHPEISFNYLGQFDQAEAQTALFRLTDGPVGQGQHADERRVHLLDVVASVQGGRFRVAWHYSTDVHLRATIERLAASFVESLRELIDHCLRLLGSGAELADFYPLAPMQQGLLFHSLQSSEPDLYVEQLQGELHGALDPHAFERAWKEIIRRHDVFRTSFVWEGLDEPLQRVHRQVAFRVDMQDWREVEDQAARQQEYLRIDRERPVALDQAPLFRVALMRLADARWQFVWTHHHALLDGWCTNLVVREVLDCYEAFTKGTEPRPQRSRPYRDYIDWLAKQDTEAARKYWTWSLAGFTTPTRLQLVERSAPDPAEPGQLDLYLSAVETRRLQAWTRRQHITLNTLVAGAWARLLQTCSGANDVVFGVTVSGRPASLAGSDEMIGLFINTLPMRVADGRGMPLLDWLHGVQSRQTELREFEYSRLVDVQRWSDLPAGEPLFETLLAFDNYPVDRSIEQQFGELSIHNASLAERTHYPLTLSVVPSDELRMRALYDANRFGAETIQQLLETLRTLLLSAVNSDVAVVDDWSLVTREQRQSQLDGAGIVAPPAADECLGSWFTRLAAARPDRLALSYEGERLTYEELETRANQLAHELRAHGVRAETLVGLCLPRSVELVIGILGIIKAGGAYVPLDPSYPAQRLRFVVEDSGVTLVVTQSSIDTTAFASGVTIVRLDGDDGSLARQPSAPPAIDVVPNNAAYVIYTSGSTGRPKGCLVTHANVSRLMKQTERLYEFDQTDVWTLFHSAAFDFSVWEIWGALLYGGHLVVVPHAVTRAPEQFYDLLLREGVTILNQTPSAFRQLISVDEERGAPLALRYVIFGGEALRLESLRGWFERHGDATPLLVNMYGITETTVHVTHRPIQIEDLSAGSRIGTPIADLKLYLLDACQQLVPEGMAGELYVAGEGIARGYLGHPALTAERMLPNPFGPGRLYRTGDLARRRDLDLEYLGRADDQVKVRGFRIETGEIESVLAQHPGVREAVVLLKAFGDAEDKRLVAYTVHRDAVTIDELRAFLATRLPDYMIPAAFVFLDEMPLTANGKINRAALPLPNAARPETYVAPRTDAERSLAEIWGDVLDVALVGIHDNFFTLGGDSIRSIRILSRARARGLEYSFQDLFARPTIAELTGAAMNRAPEDLHTPPFGLIAADVRARLPEDVDDAYPLTRLQEGMFFYSDFDSGATAYHDVMSYHLRAPYDAAALAGALATMTARHPILRTSFDFTSYGEPLQLVHHHARIDLAETDLCHAASHDSMIEAWIEDESRHPFEPGSAPLLRVQVHRRTDDTFQFSVSFHHAILDGWSLASLLTELFREYLHLPFADAAALTFRDYVALERRAAEDPRQREFWTSFLDGAPYTELPRLAARAPRRSIRRHSIEIGEDTSRGIRQLADSAGIPIRSVLLAAHVRALSHITNQRDVVTGLVTNGRPEEAGGDRVLGLFLNTVPFRLRVGGGSWLDLVRETFRAEQQINPRRRYPLSDIQKAVGGSPLFDTDFNFVHFHVFDQLAGLAGVESLGADGVEETNFTLAVNFSWWGDPGRLSGALDYDSSLLTEEQAERYAHFYGAILDAMASHPGERHETNVLTPPIVEFDIVGRPAVALHDLIAPSSPLGATDGLTYERLHARANQLAHALRASGVAADVLVGVALPPGDDRVVALLGILKAGGAYLPLDPEYPRPRLAIMIEDSALTHLVTRPGVLPADLPSVAHVLGVDHPFESEAVLAVDVAPDNLAYALYTSGSTGRPKGVLIPHRAIVNHMLWMQEAYPLTTSDRVLQKTPFSFDASVWEFWAPLIAGASMSIAKAGGQQDPAYLIDTIRERGITILQVVPTLLEALLAEPAFGQCRSLRRVFVGGEALSSELVRRFQEALPGADLINLYGPTEATIDATSHRLEPGERDRSIPIGRPIANARAYVLDEVLQFVPPGTDGDLYIAGDGLGRGYLNRAALTAASFLPDPYGPAGARMYRTGDRARMASVRSGNRLLEFRGRADEQIKLRGYRVELGEIETALSSHDAIVQAAVASIDNRLIAYVVQRRGVETADLRAHLLQLLPEHMVPSVFLTLERLPLTPSGKIDRRALPAPEAREAAARSAYVAPVSGAEIALAAAWESILGMRPVGIHDNFFELGGDSIISLRIVSRVRQAGWSVTPKLMLQHQTIALVAAHAVRLTSARAEDEQLTGPVPLSPIQQAFFEQDLPNPHHWNQSVMLTVPPSFSVDAFRRALRAVAEHHDVFRLRFVPTETGWQQIVSSSAGNIPFDVIEASGIGADDADRIQSSLDITNGPLMRVAHAGDRLLLVAHHLIIDGVSWRILFEDLATAYDQALRQEAIRLPEKTTTLRTWIEELQSHAAAADPAYWLQGNESGGRRVEPQHSESGSRSFLSQLDAVETDALLHELPARAHAQVRDVLLAALVETITDWNHGDTLWLDLEGHGREDLIEGVDVSRTVGWFTSVFPLALTRNSERSVGLLKSVKRQLSAVPNNGLDFGVLRYLSPDGSLRKRLAALPPRQISFNYLGRFDENDAPFRAASESTGHDHDSGAPRRYLLDIIARVVGGRLTVEWSYGGAAFDPQTIETLATAFLQKVRNLISADEAGYVPADFPLARLDQETLDALVAGSRDIEDVLPLSSLQEGLLFHALDEELAGVYLQQIAVVLDGVPNAQAFERAWNRTIGRHAVLRTSFHRRELQRPLQMVHRSASCTITWLDWSESSPSAREEAWESLLPADRAAGLDLQCAPLMRLTMVREAATRWRMLWTHHHLILDGWSLPLALQDVVSFYREESEGVPATLAPAASYAEFIAWLERRDHAAAEAYWRDALEGFDHPNEIALPAPSVRVDAPFADAELVLSEALTSRLAELAQASRVTLNTIVQSLWALLLGTWSRQRDVVFGVTVSGRPAELPGIDKTVGLFINTLPLRVPVNHGASLADLLQDVQRRQAAMSQFEFSRLVDLQQWSDVPRGRALFESIVVFENYPLGESLDDTPLADFSVRHARSVEWTHYPLTCLVTPGRALRIKLVYDTHRFERAAMEQMLDGARRLVESLAADPRVCAGSLRITGGDHGVAGPAVRYDAFFHERFSAQAALTPEACAIASEESTISYRDLDERSSQLANHLRRHGVGPETLVGLFVDRSLDMMVALLGVLKAGGAYLPLDPRFPAERLGMMIEDGAPTVLLTQQHLFGRLPVHDAVVIRIDADWPQIASESRVAPRAALLPEHLAYVIFTSGSTGRPKGVQIAHRALTNLLHSFEQRPAMTASDVLVAVTTLSFDIAALELFLPLACGARLVIASSDDAADGDRLAALLQQHAATIMQATPATWRLLLMTGWTPPASLRIWCGGEAMPEDLAGALRIHDSDVWNVYGPTETTIWSAIQPVHRGSDARSIGAPIANTTLYVVDENLQPLPAGIPGELLIGGAGVSRGYRAQPALTAERFVADPFSTVPGARAYRTGDLVCLRENGALEFLGRIDTQVKIRGFRVELGEIEAALRGVEGVREAAVVLRDHRLVAYVVRDGRADLAATLRQTLPDYMVPGIYVELDAMPLTPNGKLDRGALPRPDFAAGESAFVAPRNPVEEVLADVWQQTLGIERIGVHDNFFALGGHSLHAAQIIAWLRRAFHVKTPLRILFESPTVERLAEALSQQTARARQTADALLKIRSMSPEERAQRLAKRQAPHEDALR